MPLATNTNLNAPDPPYESLTSLTLDEDFKGVESLIKAISSIDAPSTFLYPITVH